MSVNTLTRFPWEAFRSFAQAALQALAGGRESEKHRERNREGVREQGSQELGRASPFNTLAEILFSEANTVPSVGWSAL